MNIKRMLFVILFGFVSLNAAENNQWQGTEYGSPTDYAMHFIRKSGTYYRGSKDWQDRLKLPMISVHTVMAQYVGSYPFIGGVAYVAALAHKNLGCSLGYQEMASGFFEIARFGEGVGFIATITDSETRTLAPEEVEDVKKQIDYINAHPEKVQKDQYTTCTHTVSAFLKEAKLTARMTAKCVSDIPAQEFFKKLADQDNN